MADYSQVNDYSAKDALSTGNPLKLIKGSDVDAEFSAISVAIASKFDSTDIATAGEAQAGVSNTVVITPARLTAWAQNDAGVVEDLQALSDPNADRILFWDDSAGTTTFLEVSTGLTLSGTTLTVDVSGFGARTLTAGNGLSGGGDLSADRTFDLDYNELTAAAIASGDELSFGDISDTNTVKKITFANLESTLSHDSLADFVADEHVAHSGVTMTAGEGLTGGGTIAATRTFDLDINGLTEETAISAANDYVAFYDASAAAHRKIDIDALVGSALGDGKWYRDTSTQNLPQDTKTTIVFNAEDYDQLQRGTFSTAAGTYTAGSSGARIWIVANVTLDKLSDSQAAELTVQVDGVTKMRFLPGVMPSTGVPAGTPGPGANTTMHVSGPLSLAAGEVVRVQGDANAAAGEDVQIGVQNSYIGIMEIG